MLSSDDQNPPPPESDPNSIAVVFDGSDRRRSEHREGAPAVFPVSDPPPPPAHNPNNNNFCIREYVYRSRSKDIFTNWPFSRKNLQLCLQHGVTEVLPPFQHLYTARCPSFEIHKFENRSVVGEGCAAADFKRDPSSSKPRVTSLRGSDCAAELHVDGAACNEQLSTVRPSARDDALLAATRVCRVTAEQVPAKETTPPPACLKSGSLAQTSGKKCRFIVKFDTKLERSWGDDAASNCTRASENMGSKVCPVCKTFSSSSNTTLNAHIDQCLSLESASQRLSVRHRIKPRKTRLMVDIYETAKRCTIEELNRRNGLNWANSASLPAPNADAASDEERRPSMPAIRAGNPGDASAVYRDANGTKLRILSKFNDDQPESRITEDVQLKKASQGKKGHGILKKKTKKLHSQKKHYKYLKFASAEGKKLLPQKAHESQSFAARKNLLGTQEGGEGSKHRSRTYVGPFETCLSDTLRQWSSSKRTGPKKRFTVKEGENLQIPMRSCSRNLLDTSDDSDYSRSSDSEKGRSWPDCRRGREQEQPMICETSLAWSDVTPDSVVNWGYPPVKRKLPKVDHLGEVDALNRKRNTGHGISQIRQEGTEIHTVVGGHADVLGKMSGRQLRHRQSSMKALRFSSMRKRALYLCQSSENSSDISAGRTEFCLKKPRQHSMGASRQMSEDPAQDQSVKEGADLEISSSKCSERKTVGLREISETSNPHEEVQYTKSTSNDVRDTQPSVHVLEDYTWGLSKYYEPPHLDLRDCSPTHSGAQQFLGISKDSSCRVEGDFSRAYDACDDVNMENADNKNDEVDGAGQSSSFLEIDPIPIPGPPGSFLPSPGATMGSDDFQGNSSLTTSQAQSSHDLEDLVDGDKSDSPVSATSTVSNSTEAKAGMDYSEELVSRGGYPLHPEGFSSIGNEGSSNQRNPLAAVTTPCSGLGETKGRADNVSIKKGPSFTRDVDEPCCCQKKDRALNQNSVLDGCKTEQPSLRRTPSEAMPGGARQRNQIPSGESRSDEGYAASTPKPAKPSEILSSRSFGALPNGSGRADCDFPSPSGSNPVLRLMGKDLIVVNKEDHASIPNQSPAPVKSQGSPPVAAHGIPRESRQNRDYHYRDITDYAPTPSFLAASQSGYPGITMPVTAQAPKPVPFSTFTIPEVANHFTVSTVPRYGGAWNPSIQFDTAKVEYVGPSQQMVPNVLPSVNPINSMDLPRDAALPPRTLPNASRGTSTLPAVYQSREHTTLGDPVAELARSYQKGTVLIGGKPGHNSDGHPLQRAPPPVVIAPRGFLGYHGSGGYVYYHPTYFS